MLPQECVQETSIPLSPAVPETPERRRGQRHLTILRVGALIVEGQRELCLVRNISAGGIMAHVYRALAIDARVEVEIKNDEPMAGKVVWAKDAHVGIAFDTPIDVPDLLATSKLLGNGRLARRPRVAVDRVARLRFGSEVHHVRVRDVSQGGVKVELEPKMIVDSDVVVTLDGFHPMSGIARWQRDGLVGIRFLQVIPIAELCAWLRGGSNGV